MNCQICNRDMDEHYFIDNNFADAQILEFHPDSSTGICSYKCQRNAIRINASFKFMNKVKNMQNIPYETFQDIFNFPIEGMYSKEKYKLMQRDSFLFVLGLDVDNIKKLVNYNL